MKSLLDVSPKQPFPPLEKVEPNCKYFESKL